MVLNSVVHASSAEPHPKTFSNSPAPLWVSEARGRELAEAKEPDMSSLNFASFPDHRFCTCLQFCINHHWPSIIHCPSINWFVPNVMHQTATTDLQDYTGSSIYQCGMVIWIRRNLVPEVRTFFSENSFPFLAISFLISTDYSDMVPIVTPEEEGKTCADDMEGIRMVYQGISNWTFDRLVRRFQSLSPLSWSPRSD